MIEVPLTEEMKKFSSNKDKESFLTTDIENFHYEKLSRMKYPFDEILFQHVFENLDLKKKQKASIK